VGKHLGRLVGLLVCLAAVAVLGASSASGLPRSVNVLLVPNATGQEPHGGTYPTTGFPGGFAPTFTSGSLSSIQNAATDPLTAYDTVVLVQVCGIDTYLQNATFKSRLNGFVSNGGKLIIWDSECQDTSYSHFVYPFTTNNPGALGSNSGSLNDVEKNALSDTTTGSPSFVDLPLVKSDTDAVGDANVMTSQDPHWFVDLSATNANNVTGPVQTYARYGSGLIIYNGLDMDVLSNGIAFDPASTDGTVQLGRIWLLDLLQPWNPDNLSGAVKVFGLSLSVTPAAPVGGTSATVTAHASILSVKQTGVVVTFTVTSGPNKGVTGTATTDASGDAVFSFTGDTLGGMDEITAAATLNNTPVSETAKIVWTPVVTEVRIPSNELTSSYLCWNREMVDPVAYIDKVADELWTTGNYIEPQAILGNVVGGTNVGAYHLVCNAKAPLAETEMSVGGSGEVYDAQAVREYHAEHVDGNDLNLYHIWK